MYLLAYKKRNRIIIIKKRNRIIIIIIIRNRKWINRTTVLGWITYIKDNITLMWIDPWIPITIFKWPSWPVVLLLIEMEPI